MISPGSREVAKDHAGLGAEGREPLPGPRPLPAVPDLIEVRPIDPAVSHHGKPLGRRRRLSLTRARPSSGKLTPRDKLRATIFSSLIRAAIFAAGSTMKIRTRREAELPAFRRLGPGPLLFAIWHGDFFPIFYYSRNSRACIIVSRSPDGEFLARILNRFGYCTVRGSNAHGATRAMIDLARVVQKGNDAAVAIDGPKGPALEAKAGILLLAKVTGCPIVPLGAAMTRYKEFASWDRFRFPYPFSRALLTGASPIVVPPDASSELIERKRVELQQVMLGLRAKAQELAQREHFEQADRPLGYAASWA